MSNYEDMYKNLVIAVTNSIETLQKALCETEKIYDDTSDYKNNPNGFLWLDGEDETEQ